jgi:hypothetical protein
LLAKTGACQKGGRIECVAVKARQTHCLDADGYRSTISTIKLCRSSLTSNARV